MSEQIFLSAQPRTVIGKQVKQLRRQGVVPAVIYNNKMQSTSVQVNDAEMRAILRKSGTGHLITLTMDQVDRPSLVRDIQKHPVTGQLLHIDFYEVNMLELIEAEADIELIGVSEPVRQGLGSVTQLLHTLEIECLPNALISEIQVDMGLIRKPGDVIHVGDITLPEGVRAVTDANTIIATFEYPKDEKEESDALAPSAEAVEVIKKAKPVEV